ncbi:hypothetical protein [Cryobacterium sp. PH29-G1]|uniref:hypothetical protein n=1 Tax=Cryobacterium sp. PH29-G1 TaxID=3046211 RepID=UPI0024B8B239|nr:hypothetical protein [Cryobacterium sp. PH29-G1]MDJ0349635.1 hypothetical protein [Cryobacterium sp. PH29-G1]
MALAINMEFSLMKCVRCGFGQRVAGRPCSECGHLGRLDEVNSLVVRRRQGIRAVLAHIASSEAAESEVLPFYLTRSSWRASSGQALDESIAALAKFSTMPLDSGAQLALAVAVARLQQIGRDLSTFSPRRPFVSNLKAIRQATECLVRMTDLYIAALGAALPAEAQALGKRAQDQIDAATKFMNDAERHQEIGDNLGSADSHDFVSATLAAFATLYPEKSFMEVDADRQTRLARHLGREIATGQGAAYEIALVIARSILDVNRFESVVAEASRLFDSTARLRDIAAEPGALITLRRARNAIVESTAAFAATLTASTSDESRLARTINLYRELFEYAGLPLFAWFLRIGGTKSAPISTLMQRDSTALLSAIEKLPDLASIFVGADKNIRTAASHGFGYELVGDNVIFTTRSFKGTMTVEVVIDLLLALIESFLAAFWVLDNELTVAGIEGHASEDSLVGAPMLVVAEEVLKHLGATVLSATCTETGWRFEVAGGSTSIPLVYAEGLASLPPRGIDEISIVCANFPEGELRIPRVSSAQFRLAKDASPMTLVGANLDLLSESSLDGRTAIRVEHIRWSACVAAVELLSEDNREAIRSLRQCIRLARVTGAADVVQFAELAFTQWRSPDNGRLKQVRETMMAWTTLPTPQQPLVRTTTMTNLHDSQ